MRRSLPPYLEQRPSGFYFRRRRPALSPAPGAAPRENGDQTNLISLSLTTKFLGAAKAVSRRLAAVSDDLFGLEKESGMPIPHETIMTVLRTVRDEELRAHERQRSQTTQRSPDSVAQAVERERKIQQALRQAIALGDREPAVSLLRATCTQLGLNLDEADEDMHRLAHFTMRLLVEISAERERREAGDYRSESVLDAIGLKCAAEGPGLKPEIGELSFFSHRATRVLDGAFGTKIETLPFQTAKPCPVETQDRLENKVESTAAIVTHAPKATAVPAVSLANLRIDVSTLSPETREAIVHPDRMRLSQALRFYRELKLAGYPDHFEKTQKRTADRARKWKDTTEPSFKVAEKLWLDFLGDIPLGEVTDVQVNEGLEKLRRVPKAHGKTFKVKTSYTDLIEEVDAIEIRKETEAARHIERNPGLTEAEREKILLEVRVERLRSETFLKHGRLLGRVGRCLEDLGLLTKNPFALCSWTNAEERALKEAEEARTRTEWDDRLYDLFRTPVFQGASEEPGDPLFWAPLIAVHQGLRMQECLQLGPDDFGSENGVPYLRVRNTEGNNVKSLSGERRMPIHPNLIALGLMDLVDLRRREKMPRIFPELGRGESKGTHSELFTKAFGYYRKKHGVYWPGLDFHALRTTFHGFLLNSQTVSDARRRRLMGHTPLDEGEKSYAQGLRASTLLNDIKEVNIDVSMIQSPFHAGHQKVVSLQAGKTRRFVGQR